MSKWEMARLSDVIDEAITGEWGTECINGEVGTKVLRTTNFTNLGVVHYDNVVVRNIPANKIEKKKLLRYDNILEKSGGSDNQPVGRVVFFTNNTDEVYLCNNFTQVLRINQNIAFPKYVFIYLFYLHQNGTTELLQNKTTGIRNLQVKRYMALQIPLPPLPVQQQIADVLDRASALIEKRKAQIDKLDLLMKSQFTEMFGNLGNNPMNWKQIRLIDTCASPDDIKCGPFGTQLSKDEYQNYGVALWGIPQINSAFQLGPTDFLTEEKAAKLEAYSLRPGDIAMSRKGNVGMCALFPEHFPIGIIHSDVLRIRPNTKAVNPMFLMSQLHYSPIVETQIRMVSNGAIMAGINVTKLKNIAVHLPPLTLQDEFAAFVEQVELQKELLQQSRAKLELNYKSLMQKCFRGEIF